MCDISLFGNINMLTSDAIATKDGFKANIGDKMAVDIKYNFADARLCINHPTYKGEIKSKRHLPKKHRVVGDCYFVSWDNDCLMWTGKEWIKYKEL